jgi:arylsulfatase A-like enzyme
VTKEGNVNTSPNIVFILVDNIGWGNFGVYGGTIHTPRIDQLANEGIRFNNYNVEAQCTPTRSAILTGRHPVRSGTFKVPFPGQGLSGMSPWEYTLAELLSDAGYATAVKEAGVDDNTIVILSSDNAGGGAVPQVGPGSNGPWRGDFLNTPFEGTMRAPAIIRWPGTVPAGVVTNEMLAAVDWLPTLAGMAAASKFVPKDQPIDGVDASAFMLGKSDSSGRDSYMFFGPDGELMSIKWKIYKMIFRYTENTMHPAIQSGFTTPQFSMFYDLSSDPHEDSNLFYTDLTCGWMLAPAFKLIGEYERSLKEYPNIKVGEDFKGYAS